MPGEKKRKSDPKAEAAPKTPKVPKSRAKAKASSVTPLLDAENGAALGSAGRLNVKRIYRAPGAKYNTEILTASHDAVKTLQSLWPGIEQEDPLPLGQGARQASCLHIWFR